MIGILLGIFCIILLLFVFNNLCLSALSGKKGLFLSAGVLVSAFSGPVIGYGKSFILTAIFYFVMKNHIKSVAKNATGDKK